MPTVGVLALAWLLSACDGGSDRPACNLGGNCFDGGAEGEGEAGEGEGETGEGEGETGEGEGEPCVDGDGDGHVGGRCPESTDCADDDPAISPDETESCNGLDDDCRDGVDTDMLRAGADVLLPSTYAHTDHVAFAARGDGFVLVREEQDLDNGWHLILQELDATFDVTRTTTVSETPNFVYYDTLAVAGVPDGVLVAYGDAEDRQPDELRGVLQLAHVVNGVPETIPIGGEGPGDLTPSIALGTDTVLLVWQHTVPPSSSEHWYALLAADDLSVIAEEPLMAAEPLVGIRPSVVWTDEGYLVAAMADGREIDVLTVSETGELGLPRGVAFDPFVTPSIAWDGFEAAVVATNFTTLDLVTLRADASPLDGPIDLALDPLKGPRIAGAPRAFAIAGTTGGVDTNYLGTATFTLVAPDGVATNVIAFDDAPQTAAAIDPIVVAAGARWVLAWIETGGQNVRLDSIGCAE